MAVDFYLDYRSPYSYLANTQLCKLGFAINYKPVDVLSVMKMVNNRPSPECPPKARYALADAKRWARHYDVPFTPNMSVLKAIREERIEGSLFSRVALAAQGMGIFSDLHDELFKLVWASDSDLATESAAQEFLKRIGVTGLDIWDRAESLAVRNKLADLSQEAAERGVFGVPTFFVNDEQFFGNDRLPFVEQAIAATTRQGVSA